jgi:hypothetical protein
MYYVGGQWLSQVPGHRMPACSVNAKGIVWTGHIMNQSGYAKMNREICSRITNTIPVRLIMLNESHEIEQHKRTQMIDLCKTDVPYDAPFVRGYTPVEEDERRYRICFTMMETERIHPAFISTLNANYHECWTPTQWNKQTFINSGLKLPITVMPLGVDPHIYRPGRYVELPPCELLTTTKAGVVEVPCGFLVTSQGVPTFRKGFDVVIRAFEDAFADDPEAALIINTSTVGTRANSPFQSIAAMAAGCQSRIYALTGSFSEHDMADYYRACHVYVSASRNEGWNLPITEAAACGLPVIGPRHSAHLDFLSDDAAFLIDAEGTAPFPGSESVSGWYADQHFAKYGSKSHDQLVAMFRGMKQNYTSAMQKAHLLSQRIRTNYTWDITASNVLERLWML